MSFIRGMISDRLGGEHFDESVDTYKFTRIKKAKAEAVMDHPDVSLIDMGIGEPDIPADTGIVSILAQEAGKTENRRYADNGIPEFQKAAVRYLTRMYGLKDIDTEKNILHGIGSKPILAMLPLCFVNPGDVTLATTPGYPVISNYTRYAGGQVYSLPLLKENSYYPDYGNIPEEILKRAKLLYINYPNNPTGQVATRKFYNDTVEFAYKNKIIVVSDAAYSSITYDGIKPLSFLSADGAEKVGVEVHSLSKAFNMTGWRLGFIVGNPEIIQVYGTLKDNTDSGQFRAIQLAGVYALNHMEINEHNCKRYSRRFDLLIPALNEAGFRAVKPKGSFYCYVDAPIGTKSGIRFENAEQASEYILKNALVSTVPWDDAGAFLRFSVTFEANAGGVQSNDGMEEAAEKRMMEELRDRLLRLELVF